MSHNASSKETATLTFSKHSFSFRFFGGRIAQHPKKTAAKQTVVSLRIDGSTVCRGINSWWSWSHMSIKQGRTNHQLLSFSRVGAKIWNGIHPKLCKLWVAPFKHKLTHLLLKILEIEMNVDLHYLDLLRLCNWLSYNLNIIITMIIYYAFLFARSCFNCVCERAYTVSV